MKNYYALFYCMLMLWSYQSHGQPESELSCRELAEKVDFLTDKLEERENSWITWTIQNEDDNLLTVPAEIAKESLAIWNVCGGVPSMLLVYGATLPIETAKGNLREKGVDNKLTRGFFEVATIATLATIYPASIAVNFVSYSGAFTYNEIVKNHIKQNLNKFKRQYEASCS